MSSACWQQSDDISSASAHPQKLQRSKSGCCEHTVTSDHFASDVLALLVEADILAPWADSDPAVCASAVKQDGMEMHAASVFLDMPAYSIAVASVGAIFDSI